MKKFVFPTCVGVFPFFDFFRGGVGCLPHVRGGVSRRVYPSSA